MNPLSVFQIPHAFADDFFHRGARVAGSDYPFLAGPLWQLQSSFGDDGRVEPKQVCRSLGVFCWNLTRRFLPRNLASS